MKSQEITTGLLTIQWNKPNVELIKKQQNFIENAVPRLEALSKEERTMGFKPCVFACGEQVETWIYADAEVNSTFGKACPKCTGEKFNSESINFEQTPLEKSVGGWYSKNKPIKIISWGAGMDSTILIEQFGTEADLIIIADTGSEEIETYEYMKYYIQTLPYHVREKIVVLQNHKLGDIAEWHYNNKLQPMPFANRQCTDKWKLRIIHNYIRKVYGDEAVFEMMVGINYDEQLERERPLVNDSQLELHISNVLGYDSKRLVTLALKAKVSVEDYKERLRNALQSGSFNKKGDFLPGLQYCRNVYPLCDAKIGKDDEVAIYKEKGLQIPPKSGCYFCPMKSKAEWKKLEDNHPELYLNAQKISENSTAKLDMLEMSTIKATEMRCSCNNGIFLEEEMNSPDTPPTPSNAGRGF